MMNHLPAYEDGTECSETQAHKIQTPENYPKENIDQKYLESFGMWCWRRMEKINWTECV